MLSAKLSAAKLRSTSPVVKVPSRKKRKRLPPSQSGACESTVTAPEFVPGPESVRSLLSSERVE